MATINKGILGGFSGKVGTVVGFNWRGKDVIRSLPKTGQKTPSEKQQLQQKIFTMAVAFLNPLQRILQMFYGSSSGAKSRQNIAMSYLIKNAINVVNNEPVLLYNKIIVSKGELVGFQNLIVTTAPGAIVDASWVDNSNMGNASATDKVYLIFYCADLEMFQIYEGINLRSDAELSVTLPSYFVGQEVHAWAFLATASDAMACNSFYCGALEVS